MERVKGIEPSYAAWKAAVLPLNYTRITCLQAADKANVEYTQSSANTIAKNLGMGFFFDFFTQRYLDEVVEFGAVDENDIADIEE